MAMIAPRVCWRTPVHVAAGVLAEHPHVKVALRQQRRGLVPNDRMHLHGADACGHSLPGTVEQIAIARCLQNMRGKQLA